MKKKILVVLLMLALTGSIFAVDLRFGISNDFCIRSETNSDYNTTTSGFSSALGFNLYNKLFIVSVCPAFVGQETSLENKNGLTNVAIEIPISIGVYKDFKYIGFKALGIIGYRYLEVKETEVVTGSTLVETYFNEIILAAEVEWALLSSYIDYFIALQVGTYIPAFDPAINLRLGLRWYYLWKNYFYFYYV